MSGFVTVGELARHLHCEFLGDGEKKIFGIALPSDSTDDTLTYISPHRIDTISDLKAGAVLTRASIGLPLHRNYIVTRHDPYERLADTIQFLIDCGVYDCIYNSKPNIPVSCTIGEFVSIGNNSCIGDNTVVAPGVVIEPNVKIGSNCIIGPNSVIGKNTLIGDNVVIGACCTIGTENFEYLQTPVKWVKIPVVGNVHIGSNVRIGGNVVIEKGTIGTTRIGNDCQIDNLVQIGHEAVVGENCHIVACVALAGWAEIGNHVAVYGQAAVSNHVKVGNNSVLLARSGVDKDVKEESIVSGFPAQDHQNELRFQAYLRKIFRIHKKGLE